ncbi:RNA polymerase sigma factor [Brevundimonas naejangsanensis]|uniref:RNA polymerase sigma factor n=1 Tax=Brevundimonas naejangsanensis TaxID=588932 RepID=A0A494RJN7_9CAUL|nr:RNA polymerase sigma factor [Brevundimonas naejangsanensis]AYG95649.1 RNA polymerase sigma factor [Brevundimonas naejangsanensis]
MSDVNELEPDGLEGLNALYRQYARWLAGRLRAHVDPDQAADVVQETYLRAAPYSAGGIRHPRAFLLRIAMNVVRDESRCRKRRGSSEPFTELADPGEAAGQVEALMMKKAVLTMPALYREVFVLSRFAGMSYPEIAAARGLSVKAVEWRMSKALQHCVEQLGG